MAELARVYVSLIPTFRGMSSALRSELNAAQKKMPTSNIKDKTKESVAEGVGQGLVVGSQKSSQKVKDVIEHASDEGVGKGLIVGTEKAKDKIEKPIKDAVEKGAKEGLDATKKQITNKNIEQPLKQKFSVGVGAGMLAGMRAMDSGLMTIGRSLTRSVNNAFISAGRTLQSAVVNPLNIVAASVGAVTAAAIAKGAAFNSQQQRNMVSLTTFLGSREKALEQMERFGNFATKSPFDRGVLIDAQKQLLGFGFEVEQVIPTLQILQDSVAALGGSEQELAGVVSIFAKMRASQTINTEDFNQLADRGINIPEILAKSLNMSEGKFRQAVTKESIRGDEALKAIEIALVGLSKKYEGSADEVKKTWQGSVQRIGAAFRDIGADLTKDIINPQGGGFGVIWANTIADTLRQIQRILKEVFNIKSSNIQGFFQGITSGLERVKDFFTRLTGQDVIKFIDKIVEMTTSLSPLAKFLAVAFGSQFFKGLPLIGDLIPQLTPLMVLLGGLLALSPELREALVTAFHDIFESIKPILPELREFIILLGEQLADILVLAMPIITQFLTLLIDNWDIVVALTTAVIALGVAFNVVTFISGVITTITGALAALGITGGVVTAGMVGMVAAVLAIVAVFGMAAYAFYEAREEWGAFFLSIKMALEALVGPIISFLETIWNYIVKSYERVKGIITTGSLFPETTYSGGGGTFPASYANGGVVPATPGGKLIRVAEAGRSEAIVDEGLLNRRMRDLENIRDNNGSGNGLVVQGDLNFIQRDGETPEEFARRVVNVLTSPDLSLGGSLGSMNF